MLIERERSQLFIVDIQERLAPAIDNAERAVANNVRLLTAARALAVPVFVSEQYVKGLGPTVSALQPYLADATVFEKVHFSAVREPGVLAQLGAERPQIILTGMETHVCVLQTTLSLLADGFAVFVVADAASSRSPEDRAVAFTRMRDSGARIVTTEMVLFEWLQRAATDEFRALLPLIR